MLRITQILDFYLMKIFVLIVFEKNLSQRDIANINDFISKNLQRCHPERVAAEGSLF